MGSDPRYVYKIHWAREGLWCGIQRHACILFLGVHSFGGGAVREDAHGNAAHARGSLGRDCLHQRG
jgi:hypothetical protein